MKNIVLSLVVLVSQTLVAQTVWIADNNYNAPTGINVRTTIQAVVDAASAGDIIQVQPSPTTYGDVIIDKQLILMGIGFNMDKDIPLTSNMGNITLTNNLTNTSDADGTIIKGLNFGILYPGINTGVAYTLSTILVQNCQLQYIANFGSGYSPIDGFEVRDCYITSAYYYGINFYSSTTNTIIRNNLILLGVGFGSTSPGSNIITNNILYEGIYLNAGSANTKILNNNFMASTGGDSAFNTELQNCEVSNNIFYGATPSIATTGSTSTLFQNNTFSNNLLFSTGDDTVPPTGGGVGNIDGGGNVVVDPNFVNALLLDTWSSSYDFTLQEPSAINAGNDGTDIGITGGLYPWVGTNFVLQTTAVPTIQILNTATIINSTDNLPIRVKGKSN
jgi:parallel beta helix pectate lyase-like protein